MIDISVPGFGDLTLEHLVLDYNGTLALDGTLLPGVAQALGRLSSRVQIHVITADTFGRAREAVHAFPCTFTLLGPEGQAEAKAAYVEGLGAKGVAAVGNGRNDRLMLRAAALGIAVLQQEGASAETLREARAVCPDILTALGLLEHPLRLVATLRS